MRRLLGFVFAALAVGHLVDALFLRRRWRAIPALPAKGEDAAAAELDRSGLDALDLVPEDMPPERVIGMLRRVNPSRLGTDPLHSPGGAHEALVVRAALATRLDMASSDTADEPDRSGHSISRVAGQRPNGTTSSTPNDRGALVRLTVRAQKYAPAATGIRRAPGLRAAPYEPGDRWGELVEATRFKWPPGALAAALLRTELAHLALLVGGVVVVPPAGVAALAAWSAKPALVLGPGGVGASLRRWPSVAVDTVRTLLSGREAPVEDVSLVAQPADGEVFGPTLTACPWCGSADVTEQVSVPDLLQHKPGRFRLDRCHGCGHVFQNPPLSDAGLAYYYDQFYDGINQAAWERVSVASAPSFRARVDAFARATDGGDPPRAWLDVGTGHGHFCVMARQRWPEATFDGLDISEAVDDAEPRGWIDQGHRGLFPDLAEKLTGAYDAVSMHHYLEHTRDPRAELAAAATVLQPGGHLMIEVPDPDSPWGRRLGRYWLCWFQPQHLNFVPCGNLTEALADAGFTVVSVERGPATMGWDLVQAAMLFSGHLPKGPAPWLPRPTPVQRAGRWLGSVSAVPVFAAAAVADLVKDTWARRPGNTRPGNAYRVIAKRN